MSDNMILDLKVTNPPRLILTKDLWKSEGRELGLHVTTRVWLSGDTVETLERHH